MCYMDGKSIILRPQLWNCIVDDMACVFTSYCIYVCTLQHVRLWDTDLQHGTQTMIMYTVTAHVT